MSTSLWVKTMTVRGTSTAPTRARGGLQHVSSANSPGLTCTATTGPELEFPLSLSTVVDLIDAFKDGKILHYKYVQANCERLCVPLVAAVGADSGCRGHRYVMQLLVRAKRHSGSLPNVVRVAIPESHTITIVGDIHGQLQDLLRIFELRGLPSTENMVRHVQLTLVRPGLPRCTDTDGRWLLHSYSSCSTVILWTVAHMEWRWRASFLRSCCCTRSPSS